MSKASAVTRSECSDLYMTDKKGEQCRCHRMAMINIGAATCNLVGYAGAAGTTSRYLSQAINLLTVVRMGMAVRHLSLVSFEVFQRGKRARLFCSKNMPSSLSFSGLRQTQKTDSIADASLKPR